MQADLQDPRPILLSSIDVDTSRVEFSDTPIVLLCGGPVKIKERPSDPDPPLASLRDAITRSFTPYEFFRPEEIVSWQSDAVFKNLLSFEADLASICSLVVIVLESAGALVELGAFSQLSDFNRKIIVVRSNDFINDISFINLGILRHIEESHPSSIKSYPWKINDHPKVPPSISQEVVDDVISDIKDELGTLKQSEVLKTSRSPHVIVLMCEFIRLFTALKETEIFDYLISLGVEITRAELKRRLFLLQEFKLIETRTYGESTFYIRSSEKYHRLRLGFKKDPNHINDKYQDALRIEMECIEYYNNDPKQRHRVRVIKEAKRGSPK